MRHGDFQYSPHGAGKYFAFSKQDAINAGNQVYPGKATIVETTVPQAFVAGQPDVRETVHHPHIRAREPGAVMIEGEVMVFYDPGAGGWTIHVDDNALDAMNGAGTLKLAARVEEEDIVVEVGDTGPGMPPQVASRAFDAFYTTKDAGKGTGLGLDIARRTGGERHGGLITIDSQPGNTVLRVRLPIRPPMRTAQRSADPFPT